MLYVARGASPFPHLRDGPDRARVSLGSLPLPTTSLGHFNFSGLYLTDFWMWLHPMVSQVVTIKGREFLQPWNPYQAYYLLPRDLLKRQVCFVSIIR